jgi:hypothetical protein
MNPRIIIGYAISALLSILASCGGSGGGVQAGDAGGPSRGREPTVDAAAGRDASGSEAVAEALPTADAQRADLVTVVDVTPDRGAIEVLDLRPSQEVSADSRSDLPWRTDRMPVCLKNKVDGSHSSRATKEISGIVYNCVSSTPSQRLAEPVVPCLVIGAEWYMFMGGDEADGGRGSGCSSGFEALQ